MSIITIVSIFFFCGSFTSEINAFETSQAQYEFLFKGQLKKPWILQTYENFHFITCAQKCQKNSKCIGIALGSINENENKRACYLLKDVGASDQYCFKEDCDAEFFEVYEVSLSLHNLKLNTREEILLLSLTYK